jgi:tetratricopeptide (TPR) repeat protein
LLQATNRLNEAEPLYRRALAIDENNYGPDHPNVATDLTLAIDENNYARDHPNVAIRLNNLAGLLQATNRLNEAEPLYRRGVGVLTQFTRTTGHQHPNLEAVRANYVQALTALGRSKAEIEAALRSVL